MWCLHNMNEHCHMINAHIRIPGRYYDIDTLELLDTKRASNTHAQEFE